MTNRLETSANRNLKLDNLKAILILLVVVGHFVQTGLEGSAISKGIFLFIYFFHMPLFIFTTGLVSQRIMENQTRVVTRILSLWGLYILMKILIFCTKLLAGREPKFLLFSEDGIPWYLFAIGVYCGLSFILKSIPIKTIFIISILTALVCGYDNSIKDFLVLSRVFVFYPFYLLGWGIGIDGFNRIAEYLSTKGKMITALLGLIIIFFIIYLNIDHLYFLRPFATGRHPYAVLKENFYLGAPIRLLTYGICCLISILVIAIAPQRRVPLITTMGRRTLQIYFFHSFIYFSLWWNLGLHKQHFWMERSQTFLAFDCSGSYMGVII